ncbi:ABC transporter ATP-binding protein [Petroclostridium sp. X23]|uniref:ABC transporter ATP-binding protein n=1 Tax=Petroclostridium sp. X23 TaxID=3045146 RepID=UPI0024AE0866|nr:ABC transporter ATP-binding protein [Petroclostridium sp. X23]WHH57927.1 ABC transporter ATP-binding protein [Petroclostridium sp. X23]
MLKVEGLTVKYGNITAVNNISFEVPEGKIIALIGNNGAGKTTTLKTISCLLKPSNGKILFNDRDITGQKPHDIAKQGLIHIPEGRHIFPQLTVKENLIISSFSRTIKYKNFKLEIEQVLDTFPKLRERQKQLAGTLSGGEQQMLAIARGILQKPKLLILDEPSMGLAPLIVEDVFENIKRINKQGTTVLLVEQNAQMALSVADYGYVLEVGDVVLEGNAASLLEDSSVKKIYLGEM